jgi:hypothetical protein
MMPRGGHDRGAILIHYAVTCYRDGLDVDGLDVDGLDVDEPDGLMELPAPVVDADGLATH